MVTDGSLARARADAARIEREALDAWKRPSARRDSSAYRTDGPQDDGDDPAEAAARWFARNGSTSDEGRRIARSLWGSR